MPTKKQTEDNAWGKNFAGGQSVMDHVQAIFEGAATGMSLADAQGQILECNPAVSRMLGYHRDELRGMSFADLTHPDDHNAESDLYQQLLDGELEHYQVEKRYLTKAGRMVWARVSVAPLGELGAPPATIRVIEDITVEKNAQVVQQRYQLLAENGRDIILFLDCDGRIIEANVAAQLTYGYSRDELLSMCIEQLRHPSTRSDAALQMAQAGNGILYETIHQRQDGTSFPVEVSSESRVAGTECLFVSIIRDITERKKAEAAIRFLGCYDKLTGLYNRAYFEELMKGVDPTWLPLSVVMGDVNGLRQINTALGDHYGDQILVRAAQAIRDTCGEGALASRWSGDEFVILLPNVDESEALHRCEQIYQTCGRLHRGPVKPDLALGTATMHSVDDSLQDVLQAAEERMYRNKLLEETSPRSYFISSLTQALRERHLETEEHAHRLEQLAMTMAKTMELPHDKLDELRLLATLHDIGKVGIPDDILRKPGPLTAAEWKTMRKHSEIGYRIAESTPELLPIARAILTHHERWDGKGYPLGLKGEEIPLIARIISIIDTYDVMTNGRPYQQPVGSEEAIAEIRSCAGSQFDPRLVDRFTSIYGLQSSGARVSN